jgi:nucleotide-binding universal stress UspA family protein
MTFVVPFDGSARTKTALDRARKLARGVREPVSVITVIPADNASYARKMGWLASDEPFDGNAIVSTLRSQVADIAADATFEYETCSRDATANSIAKPIRKFAKRKDASTVVIGSDSAGRTVTRASSVGGRIASDDAYDVLIVRNRQ